MITNQERLKNIDVLFKRPGRPYITELEQENSAAKIFKVLTLKDNSTKIDELSEETNALIKDHVVFYESPEVFEKKSKELEIISNKLDKLIHETEKTGEIKFFLVDDIMKVSFFAHGEQIKEFSYREGEYLDSTFDFLDREYSKHLNK